MLASGNQRTASGWEICGVCSNVFGLAFFSRRFIVNVKYQETAKQGEEGYALLQQATKVLEGVLGPSVDQVAYFVARK
jgi:hypothetical protein